MKIWPADGDNMEIEGHVKRTVCISCAGSTFFQRSWTDAPLIEIHLTTLSHPITGQRLFTGATRSLDGFHVQRAIRTLFIVQTAWRSAEEKKDFLFYLTTALHLPLHCKNGLGCKWLVHVKVFSTLILDSRYFYSLEAKCFFFFLSYAERQPPVLFSSM